ncbi:perlucin-like protein [Mercenaria mercenaria]|uniref:perlucin-like protein n=1 Tax=Mercenaria mercenaria TaxID=6596 RepID=UPI00234F270F|nr:perlucin-like protein [Mercenaria mercenaria]
MVVSVLFGILTFTAIHTTKASSTCCPDSWLPFKGSCYQFYDEDKVDWAEAVSICRLKNSDLVTVETEYESKFLKFFARKLFKRDSGSRNVTAFWLGASDTDIDGIWKWVSTDEELTYTEWDVSQPNNKPDNKEDCMALNGAYDFNWHDGVCKQRVGYPLCEKKGTSDNGGVGMQVIG